MKKTEINYSMEFEKEEPQAQIGSSREHYYSPSLVELLIVIAAAVGLIAAALHMFSEMVEEEKNKQKLTVEERVYSDEYINRTRQLVNSTKLFLKKHYGYLDNNTKTYYGNSFLTKTKSSYKLSNFKYVQFTKVANYECNTLAKYIVNSDFQYKIQSVSINNKIVETKNDKELSTSCSISKKSTIKINL